MSYKKVYYDELWELTSNAAKKCDSWRGELETLSKANSSFIETCTFTGQAADSMKSYVSEIHGSLISLLNVIVTTYMCKASDYYDGYQGVDWGDGSNGGSHKTTIVYDEVNENGSIKRKIENVRGEMDIVASDANRVKNSISDLVVISAYPKTESLTEALDRAIKKATTVNKLVGIHESKHANDFVEIDELIAQAQSIIDYQLGQGRIPTICYQSGSIAAMCDIDKINMNMSAAADYCNQFIDSDGGQEALAVLLKRDEILQEERKQATQWIKIGVAIVGGVILIAVTAGGATPGVCAIVGATVGGVTAGTNCLVDNYVENGDVLEGMDWSNFGKEVTIGAVTGAISGYAGGVSQGSAIKQPLAAAWNATKYNVAENLAGNTINTLWDVGEAVITQKPGDEIKSIFWKDVKDGARETLKEGAEAFVGGWVTGKFAVDTSDKGYLQKFSEATAASTAGSLAKGTVNFGFDAGEAIWDNNPETTVTSALYKNIKSTSGDIIGGMAENAVSSIDTESFKNPVGKVAAQTAQDTVSDTFKRVGKGMTERTIDYGTGKIEGSKIIDDIWEKDLEGGGTIAEAAGKSLGKHVTETVTADQKYYNDMRKHDKDGDGKLEFIQFEGSDYAVTKEDYEAAQKVAGRGAYKDKTVQDILGLDRDTDLNTAKERTVDIRMTEEYSYERKTVDTVTVDDKYTFKKDYYESTINAAGKGEYKDKSAQELLGVPEDTDLDNYTSKRVDKNVIGPDRKIGEDKNVKLTSDSGTNATKVNISSMYHESKLEREEAKEKAAANKKEHPYSNKTYKDFYKKESK